MKQKLFSIKSLILLSAKGGGKKNSLLLEERVVLIKAKNSTEAIRKGEIEARQYAREAQFINILGQKVTSKVLKAIDAFELFEAPKIGSEIYSYTEVIDRSVASKVIIDRKFGPKVSKGIDKKKRKAFQRM